MAQDNGNMKSYNEANGELTLSGKGITFGATATDLDMSASSGVFKTPTGATTLGGSLTLAAGKNLSVATGAGAVDFSPATGTFKTSTGTNTLGGDVSIAAGKNLSMAAGAGAVDLSSATGTFATPTGAATLNGTTTVATAKTLAVTDADKLTVGGVIAPQEIEVSFHGQAATAMVDQSFFVATQAYQVTKIRQVHAVAETTAATLRVQVTKDTSTAAPGAGTDLLTNTSGAGFDCKATANTVQTGALSVTASDLQLAAGDRLSVDFTAGATELVGCTITVTLKRI